MEKFAIIGGDIHKLVKLKKDDKPAWFIHEQGDLYWVPVKDEKADQTASKWYKYPHIGQNCPHCRRRYAFKTN